jgi:hypothetical protein
MTESKEVDGFTLYKCPYLKNTWITERSCLLRQNKRRQEFIDNYPRIKYASRCITCKDGLERAERLDFKLIGVDHILNKRKSTRKRSSNIKKIACSVPEICANSITLEAERKSRELGYKSIADCLRKLHGEKTQVELGNILGVHHSSIWFWYKKLGLTPLTKTCSIPNLIPTERTLKLEEKAKEIGYKSLADFLLTEVGHKSHNQAARMIGAHPGSIHRWMMRLKNA